MFTQQTAGEGVMIHRHSLSDSQAKYAIENGEFDSAFLRSKENIAVILTQGWCPQWTGMDGWLQALSENKEPKDIDIDVFQLVYDEVEYFSEFRRFKEGTWNNGLIPYVRYYRKGKLVEESNYVSADAFLAVFSSF